MADESEADVCDALQRDLDGAILRLLGEAASRFRLFRGDPVKREAVCPAGGRDRRGADLQSSVPCGTFRRMQVAAQRQGVDAPAPVRSLPGGGVRVTVVSEFGFEHQREYASGAKLGEAILQELAAPAALVANARVGKDGTLYFVSRLFMERQRGLGKLLCTVCGTFSASEKGLRHHQQIVHGTSYEESKDFAELAKHQQLATVVTNNPVVALALQQARQNAEAEAARARAARAALDPGLAAARDGDLAVLRELVSDGWDVTTPDRYGSCALQWAAGAGHLAVVRWLVEECGLDPRTTVQPKDGRNALHWACRNGKLRVCQWLVEHGRVDPSTPTKDGTSPFHWAVWQGHVGVGEWLIEIGADWRAKNSFGCNAVQWAALSGSVSMCRWLQSVGLEIDLLNDNGHSALHKAAVKGQQSVCTWLLSPDGGGLSAQHMLPDGDGNTPAEMARLEGYTELGSWLEAENVRLLRADKLASVNADFEAEHTALELDSQGRTTVHHAAKAGSTELLSRVPMSELQRVDRFGRAAIHYAAQAGNSVDSDGEAAAALAVCCRRLDNEEAAILAADKAGCTVLHYAAMQPTSCFVKVLLSTSRPVYMKLLVAQDRGGKTGMHYAAERGSASSIELMIACLQQCRNGTATSSASALIQTDRAGRTPLHFSAHRGKKGESVVLACLSDAAGVASITMVDRSGKTPLHLLAEHSTASSVQTCLAAMVANEVELEEAWAAVDQKQRTPLHYAARNSDSRVMSSIAAHYQNSMYGSRTATLDASNVLARLLCKADEKGQLPVHHACRFSSAGGVIACLQEMGIDANGTHEGGDDLSSGSTARDQLLTADHSGRLALHYAASAYGTYKRKMGKKATERADDQDCGVYSSPRAAVVSACLAVDPHVARKQVLHADGDSKLPAFYAADLESADALAAILSAGKAVAGDTAIDQLRHQDRDGRCVMHFAARRRTPAAMRVCVDALRSGSIDAGERTRSEMGHRSAASFLHIRDRYGKLPADYASTDVVKAFLNEALLGTAVTDYSTSAPNSGDGAGCKEEQRPGQAAKPKDARLVVVRRPQPHLAERGLQCPWDNSTCAIIDAATSSDESLVPAVQPTLEKSIDKGSVFAEFLVSTFGTTTLARGAGVLDVAGGKGELSRALGLRGIPAVIVDPMCCGINDGSTDAGTESDSFPQYLRVAFNWQFGDTHSRLLQEASCLVGLHPDQPTGAIVEVALAHEKPFAVVPCCVFSSQFPERTLAGKLVRQTEELVEWLCHQVRATGRRPQVATLPMRGRNVVVFSTLE